MSLLAVTAALKYLGPGIKAIQTVGSLTKWLSANRDDPLAKALHRTITEFEPELPLIRGYLQKFLALPATEALVTAAAVRSEDDVLEELARDFASSCELFA